MDQITKSTFNSNHIHYYGIIFGYLRLNIAINKEWLDRFALRLLEYSETRDDIKLKSIGITLSSLINKNYIESSFADTVITEDRLFKNQLLLISWIAKGLVLKQDNKGYEICKFLMDQGTKFGNHSAKFFALIVKQDSLGFLTKDANCIQKMLYRQKLYTNLIPSLISRYHSINNDQLRENILITISTILKSDDSINKYIDFEPVFSIN